jgi:hypothetical protein
MLHAILSSRITRVGKMLETRASDCDLEITQYTFMDIDIAISYFIVSQASSPNAV